MNAYQKFEEDRAAGDRFYKRGMAVLAGVAIGVVAMLVPLFIVADVRDELQLELEHDQVRLDECRRRPIAQFTCTSMGPTSKLFACNVKGSRFVWLAYEGSAALQVER